MSQHDRKAWRKGSVYAADFRPLDHNQRAKILFLAEAMDRRTHQPGQHGGFLGRSGLAVLRALITRFHNVRTGRLDPSYRGHHTICSKLHVNWVASPHGSWE